MRVEKMTVGSFEEHAYLYIDDTTKKAFIIDPGAEAERILSKVKEEQLEVAAILITHGHFDHIGAVEQLRDALGCEVIAHKEAKKYLSDTEYNVSNMVGVSIAFEADRYVEHGEKISVEGSGLEVEVIHAPGHTLDGVAYYNKQEGVAFVGDIIFKGAVGRSDLPGGDMMTLLQSIKDNIFTLPKDVVLYPGHGESTTVQVEENTNPFFNLYD